MEKTFRILFTGGREVKDYQRIQRAIALTIQSLIEGHDKPIKVIVVHGAARGADELVSEFVNKIEHSIPGVHVVQERHPVGKADIAKYGKRAYFLRNKKMVDLGADICVACPNKTDGSPGTQMTIKLAKEANISINPF